MHENLIEPSTGASSGLVKSVERRVYRPEYELSYLDVDGAPEGSPGKVVVVCLGGKGINDAKYLTARIPKTVPLYAWDEEFIAKPSDKNTMDQYNGGVTTRSQCFSIDDLAAQALNNAELLLVTFGLGGKFGADNANTLAKLAALNGIPVVTFATRPFSFEGARQPLAERSYKALGDHTFARSLCDNDSLIELLGEKVKVSEAFHVEHQWTAHKILGITALFALNQVHEMRHFMAVGARLLMGYARALGDQRARLAFEAALQCPLLPSDWKERPQHVQILLTSGITPSQGEIDEVERMAQRVLSPSVPLKTHGVEDRRMGEWLYVTLFVFENP